MGYASNPPTPHSRYDEHSANLYKNKRSMVPPPLVEDVAGPSVWQTVVKAMLKGPIDEALGIVAGNQKALLVYDFAASLLTSESRRSHQVHPMTYDAEGNIVDKLVAGFPSIYS